MVSPLFPLIVEAAQTSRRGKVLVGPIDLRVQDVGATVVIGPNGSGKTTLLRLLHGAARLSSGSIRWGCPTQQARNAQASLRRIPFTHSG